MDSNNLLMVWIRARDVSDAAHLAYWMDGRDPGTYAHHIKAMQDAWEKLKVEMEPAPAPLEGVAANMAMVVEQYSGTSVLGAVPVTAPVVSPGSAVSAQAVPEHVGLSEFHDG